MKRTIAFSILLSLFACFVFAGCDVPLAPPKTAEGHVVKVLAVKEGDQAELAAVTAAEKARVNYEYRLNVLQSYYERIGNLDKYRWTRRELKYYQKEMTFRWQGLAEITPPAGESLADVDERLLVEQVVAARNAYHGALAELVALYQRKGENFKAALVRSVQQRHDPVRTYMYFLNAEIPGPDLRPTEVVPVADTLFEAALKLHRQGKIVPLLADYRKEREALEIFRDLIAKYPNSTKIARAAYYIAEIYKEYFNEDIRAVNWYRRAWQWDPTVMLPARFQAATVYDLRLGNNDEAVKCYKLAIQYEQFNRSNVRFACQRIKELTGQWPVIEAR